MMSAATIFKKSWRNYPLMAALMRVLMLCIMNMLMDVILTLVLVCMFVLIICMATHLDSPPVSYLIILSSNFDYKMITVRYFKKISVFPGEKGDNL